jgi:carbon-monoxide dehydrogenase small subunit
MSVLSMTVNGKPVTVNAPPLARLLDVLRLDLALTGTKEGCGEGECGACTVLIDGLPVNSCLVAAGQCAGRTVDTVEGLARDGELTALQRCFVEHGGAQCGICTPGMLVAAEALLRNSHRPSAGEVREAIAGNLCRCTGYQRIVDAILETAKLRAPAQVANATAGVAVAMAPTTTVASAAVATATVASATVARAAVVTATGASAAVATATVASAAVVTATTGASATVASATVATATVANAPRGGAP